MIRIFPSVIRNVVVAVTAVICFSSGIAAEISRITVDTHSGVPFSRDLVLDTIQLRVGSTFDPAVLSQDIEQLYQSKLVTDVATDLEQLDDGTVALHFTVEPIPRVGSVIVEGNQHFSTSKVRDKITVQPGDLLDRAGLAESALAIRELYQQKGYHGTTVVAHERSVPDTSQIDVVFAINETQRHKIRAVEFEGNEVFKQKTLRKQIQTDSSFWARFFPIGFLDPQMLVGDRQMLRQFYASHGYLDLRVKDIDRVYSRNRKWVTLIIQVEEGQPYTVDQVSVQGNKRFGSDQLKDLLTLDKGDTYSPIQEGADVREIQNKYRPFGYLDLQVRVELDKNQDTHTVDVTYLIEEGGPSTVRNIYITGNEVTKDEVIRRELRIHPGDLADENKIDQSERVLRNLGYFGSVDVAPRSTADADSKDLVVDVEEQRTGQLMIGAGISSEQAVVGMIEVSQRNFDWRNWPSFTGGGQRMRLRLQAGTERDEYILSFVEPWWLDRQLRLELNALHMTRDEDEYTRETTGGEINVSRRWRSVWQQTVGYRINSISLVDFEDDVSDELADEEGDYTVSGLVFALSRDTRDSFVYPNSGSQVVARTEFQPDFLGSYSNVYKLSLQATKYYPIFPRTVLRLRGELAVVDELSGDQVAIFDRYFAGGASTIRGFDRREVSPVDENEDSLGGKSMLLGSSELIYEFSKYVRASVFSDFGNVWSGAYDWDPADLNVSVGVGVELQLPIGPVRIDYGYPVTTVLDHLDGDGRLHFKLGYYF